MNDVPIGTQMIVKSSNKKVVLVQKFIYPTTFVTKDENGVEEIYPVGLERTITFSIKGKFSYGINDESFYDNKDLFFYEG